MNLTDKLEILADAAKYDASCASSGAPRRDSAGAAGGELMPRVPGIGIKNAKRLEELRRLRRIRWEDLSRLRCGLKKLAPFVITADYRPPQAEAPSELLRRHLADAPRQMDLWPELQAA